MCRRRTQLGAVALAIACSLPAPAAGAEATSPQRVALEERARVRVHALRIRFEPVAGVPAGSCSDLGLGDLKVSLRGEPLVPERLIELERPRKPTLHALLVDTSNSMGGRLEYARDAARQYVEQLDPGLERATIVGFDDSVMMIQPPTRDRDRLLEAIAGMRMGSLTSMLDGLYLVVDELDNLRERPVVVLLTDGVDSSSLHERADVRDLADLRPDLTVFTIGYGLPPMSTAGPPGLISTRRFLQNLATATHGKFFEAPTGRKLGRVFARIRELLDNEATLTFVDPEPDLDAGRVKVRTPRSGCSVSVLHAELAALKDDLEPAAALPAGQAQLLLPGPLAMELYENGRVHRLDVGVMRSTDPRCVELAAAGQIEVDEDQPWFLSVSEGRLSGCALDITMEHGPLYSTDTVHRLEHNAFINLKTRPFEIEVPSPPALPGEPAELLDRLAEHAIEVADSEIETDIRKRPAHRHARPYHDYPALIHGRMFLENRAQLARALYGMDDYGDWLLERLAAAGAQQLDRLTERFRAYAPDLTEDELLAVARQSPQGQEILARAKAPTRKDLESYLGAWLGDVSAHELFVRWEALHIDRLIAGVRESTPFPDAWQELRRVFFVPSYARVLTLLSPVYDDEDGRVGFWRVLLPRPAWLLKRVQGLKRHPDWSDLPLDLIPDLPLGYRVVEQRLEQDETLARKLVDEGYRVRDIRYELQGKAYRKDPSKGFQETRITVELARGEDGEAGRGLKLIAEVRLDEDLELTIDALELASRLDR